MLKNKKRLFIISIILICMIIATVLILFFVKKNRTVKTNIEEDEEEEIDVEKLENDFENLFKSEDTEYVINDYIVEDQKVGLYEVNAHIPYILIDNTDIKEINDEIYNTFAEKIISIFDKSTEYTILDMKFTSNVYDNILSIVIKCVLKEGNNPQRTIIKTYNYNLETNKLVNIYDIIPDDKRETVQKQIDTKIEQQIKREQSIASQGYSIYRRDGDSSIYNLENATEFFIDENGIIYIIYCYGNADFTSEVDMIITKIS